MILAISIIDAEIIIREMKITSEDIKAWRQRVDTGRGAPVNPPARGRTIDAVQRDCEYRCARSLSAGERRKGGMVHNKAHYL